MTILGFVRICYFTSSTSFLRINFLLVDLFGLHVTLRRKYKDTSFYHFICLQSPLSLVVDGRVLSLKIVQMFCQLTVNMIR